MNECEACGGKSVAAGPLRRGSLVAHLPVNLWCWSKQATCSQGVRNSVQPFCWAQTAQNTARALLPVLAEPGDELSLQVYLN